MGVEALMEASNVRFPFWNAAVRNPLTTTSTVRVTSTSNTRECEGRATGSVTANNLSTKRIPRADVAAPTQIRSWSVQKGTYSYSTATAGLANAR